MDNEFTEWVYLQFLVGNFEGLYQYYFGSLAYLAPWFRQGSVGILYSIGLAWAGFCFLKAPVDRLLAGVSVLGMIFLAGFLVSPTTNTKNLGSASGTELSVGGYYAFVLAGSITHVFQDIVNAAWNSSISAAGGTAGPSKEALAMAYRDDSKAFADKFLHGEGAEAVMDFQQKCGAEALKATSSNEQRELLKTIGIGSNTLGMDAVDATDLYQFVERSANGNIDMLGRLSAAANIATSPVLALKTPYDAYKISSNRTKAENILKELPISASTIDGTKGYRIPTSDFYTETLSGGTDSNISKDESFVRMSESGSDYEKMMPNGATTVTPNSDEDYSFYPKNCYDLYIVARDTMKSLRVGTKDLPEYQELKTSGAYMSISTADKVRHGITEAINEKYKKLGIEEQADSTTLDNLGDYYYDSMNSIASWFDKWMLTYKIPITISSMAMIVALLLLTFPIFAVLSVVFGPKVLVSYLKLMAFPFLVVFINTLLLLLSANIITFNKAFALVTDTFRPGAVDVPASMAKMTAETIVYTVICVCEVAIVKFILWDDVRAITSFNPGSAGTNAAARGASMVGAAIALVGGAFGRVGKAAAAAKAGKSTQRLNQTLSTISQKVTAIANSGSRTQNREAGLSRGGQGGGTAQGGGKKPRGGQDGGNTLVPPKPPTA